MERLNMNELWVENCGSIDGQKYDPRDNSTSSDDGSVTVYFRDLEQHLTHYIREASMVLGCVAWLTSENILKALAEVKEGVAIIVQKEDFLRPDLGANSDWKQRLRKSYDTLKMIPARNEWRGLLGYLSVASWGEIAPVRCVGNHNRDKLAAFPRMHNKFLVFCRSEKDSQEEIAEADWRAFYPKPYAVWTGSFNFTKNAAMSLENTLYLTDAKAVQAYFNEWEQIMTISEPLDWDSDWAEPEWRIGT